MFAKNALVAAAALLASIAAQAQSTVTVYGNVDVAVGSFEADMTHRVTKVDSNVLTGSFLGFKGQEDLGGGLKAFFKLESDIGVDQGTAGGLNSVASNSFWNRTSEIGLTNAYGTLTAGNSLSLATRANNVQSPFSVFGRLNGLQSVTTGAGFFAAQTDTVTITSAPYYSGFTAAAQYGASETHGDDSIYAAQVNYAAGPVAAGLTYTDNDRVNKSLVQLGGSYDFGAAKAFGQIGKVNVAHSNDTNYFQLGVAAPVTAAGTVLASWTHAKTENVQKSDELSVAYDHALSKRTGAYAGLQYVQTKPNGGESTSGVSLAVGLHHAF